MLPTLLLMLIMAGNWQYATAAKIKHKYLPTVLETEADFFEQEKLAAQERKAEGSGAAPDSLESLKGDQENTPTPSKVHTTNSSALSPEDHAVDWSSSSKNPSNLSPSPKNNRLSLNGFPRDNPSSLNASMKDTLTSFIPSPDHCPTNWSRYLDSCYLLTPHRTSWTAAHHVCASLDSRARLAAVHGRESSEYITALAATGGRKNTWIGLTRVEVATAASATAATATATASAAATATATTATATAAATAGNGWGWSDGTEVRFTNWDKSQPNGRKRHQDCVHLGGRKRRWHDNECWRKMKAVCEIKLK